MTRLNKSFVWALAISIVAGIGWQSSVLLRPESQTVESRARTLTLNGSRQIAFDTTKGRLANGEKVWITGQAEMFVYDNTLSGFNGGTKVELVATGLTGGFQRQFKGPVHASWFGPVTGDNSALLTAAFAACVTTGQPLYLDVDYPTTGTHDVLTIKGIVGPGAITGATNLRAAEVTYGTVTEKVDPAFLLPAYPVGQLATDFGSQRSYAISGSLIPALPTQAVELRMTFPTYGSDVSAQIAFFDISVVGPRGHFAGSNTGGTRIDIEAIASSTTLSSVQTNDVQFRTVKKHRQTGSSSQNDIDVRAYKDGNDMVIRIQPVLTTVGSNFQNLNVDIKLRSQSGTSWIPKLRVANWTLLSGQTALTFSSNEVSFPVVYAYAHGSATVTEQTAYLQSKIEEAKAARAKLVIVGLHSINGTLSTASWNGMLIEGLQNSVVHGIAKHGLVWKGTGASTSSMLTIGGQFGEIKNLAFYATDPTNSANYCRSAIGFEEVAGIGEGEQTISQCSFIGGSYGVYAGLEGQDSNKADLLLTKCSFINNLTAGFSPRTAQNVNYQLINSYWQGLGDAPMILVKGGGGIYCDVMHIVNCNEVLRLDADATATGLGSCSFYLQKIKVDGGNTKVPVFLNMVDQAGTEQYGGTIEFRHINCSSNINDPASSPKFIIRGDVLVTVDDLRTHKPVTAQTWASMNYGGNVSVALNPRLIVRNCRLNNWNGTINQGNMLVTLTDDGGIASQPYYSFENCFTQTGYPLANRTNLPTINSSATVTKSSGGAPGWDAGTSFIATAPAGSECEIRGTVLSISSSRIRMGLSVTATPGVVDTIDYSVYVNDSNMRTMEDATTTNSSAATLAVGSTVAVKRLAGGTIQYLHNGSVVQTSGLTNTGVLEVDTTFFDLSKSLGNIQFFVNGALQPMEERLKTNVSISRP